LEIRISEAIAATERRTPPFNGAIWLQREGKMLRSVLIVSFLLTSTVVMAEPAQDIKKLATTYQDNFNKKDAAGIAALFAKGGFLVNANGVNSDIAKYYEGAWKNGLERMEITVDQVLPVAEAVAVANGEARISGKNDKGEPINMTVLWTATDVQEGGQWKIRMLTALPKAPPPKQ
jgi:uncharacterized protein (TIGR02246 family)